MRVALEDGETLADYAFRVTSERDEAVANGLTVQTRLLQRVEEIRQLRSLLRECRSFVAAFPGATTHDILARLDAAIGGE